MPLEVALAALAHALTPPGRFEHVGAPPNVVVDYAHTPDALSRAIAAARSLTEGRVWVVFGAGGDRDRSKRPELGRAAAHADRLVITSDNPRSESPEAIAAEILQGAPSGTHTEVQLDRALAIRHAVGAVDERDVVLVAGKGHERTQCVGNRVIPFDDREVARAALGERAESAGRRER